MTAAECTDRILAALPLQFPSPSLRVEILDLVEQAISDAGAAAVRRTLDEPLNSGDGAYRP